jgi:hypothetical protein
MPMTYVNNMEGDLRFLAVGEWKIVVIDSV